MTFLSDGLSREASASTAFAPDITVQAMMAGRASPVHLVDADAIRLMPYVAKVVPRSWGYVEYNGRIYTVMGIDPVNMPIPNDINFVISQGEFLSSNRPYTAVIGKNLADTFNLKINDVLMLQTESGMGNYSFVVSGIFQTNVNLYTSDLILVNINDAQQFFSECPGCTTDLAVYMKDSVKTNQVAAQITTYNPMLRVLTRDAIKDATLTTYGGRSGFVSIAWYILLFSVILVAWNQATAAGTEMKKEVGILKALGFSTFNILEIRFIETLLLGFIAATLGIALAIFYDVYLGAPVLRDFMLGWSAVYPGYPLPINISLSTVAILYASAIFPLFIGSLIPAWRSAITEPDVAMRGT